MTYDNVVLSAAHVVAMGATGTFLPVGTPIHQPDVNDNRIGELKAHIPIDFSPGAVNYADAAIVSIDAGVNVSQGRVFSEEGDYTIDGWTTVFVDDVVRKSGPTTNLTTGWVRHTSKSITVQFDGKAANFADQIQVRLGGAYFALWGDSGSPVDKGGKLVGIVVFIGFETGWWGNPTASLGFISKAQHIINGLGINLNKPIGGGGGGSGNPSPEMMGGGIEPVWETWGGAS